MNSVVGHEAIRSALDTCRKQGTLSHAYLFVGPERVGKRALVEWLIDTLAPCERIMVGPLVEDIRAVRSNLSQSALGGRLRVVLIDNADRINTSSGNALLKELEEPPENVMFVLIARSMRAMLPTVVSRCQVIRCSLVPSTRMREAFAERAGEAIDDVLTYAAGRPGVAYRLLEDPGAMKEYADGVSTLTHISSQPFWRKMEGVQLMKEDALLDRYELALHLQCIQGSIDSSLISSADRIRNLRSTPILQQSKNMIDQLFVI